MSSQNSIKAELDALVDALSEVILGKEQTLRLIVACLLARGHVLLEDVPGVGKTTLAHALARVLGLSFQRVQFTSDLLPADILGVSIYDRESGQFKFHQGPIFAQMVLADEVNRATPKTQSALLEAMEERQVTVEGDTKALPQPFFVVATQNPTQQIGTFPLPESQLDRFMMRLALGYPDPKAERRLLQGESRRDLIKNLPCLLSPTRLDSIQKTVVTVKCSEALLDYVQALIQHSRVLEQAQHGLSPRAGLALLHCAQAWALLQGRDYVMPEDVQMVFPAVAEHRLFSNADASQEQDILTKMLHQVAIP